MDGQNHLFKNNVETYLRRHSIIVPSNFMSGLDGRDLVNGLVYEFDLQRMTPGEQVRIQPEVAGNLVILTILANRGRARGRRTNGINAMWLAGPPDRGASSADLPGAGTNYVFTESLGGCSVYISNGRIIHEPSGLVPDGVDADQQVRPQYVGRKVNFDQTCAVAYKVGGMLCGTAKWKVGTSVPHDAGGFGMPHGASRYLFSGYQHKGQWPAENP